MAQTQDARAQKDIIAAIEKDQSDKVREQAVFALSQLKDDQADAALIALVRGNYPRKVKEQALFWLGQSGSNEALKFLDEVLTKQPAQAAKS
jgi:HEAT repeat protein